MRDRSDLPGRGGDRPLTVAGTTFPLSEVQAVSTAGGWARLRSGKRLDGKVGGLDAVPVMIDVSGVEVLELRVGVSGGWWGAHAVWLDPTLVGPDPAAIRKAAGR